MKGLPSMGNAPTKPDATLDARILTLVTNSLDRLTPQQLNRLAIQGYGSIHRDRVKASIKRLVEQKELVYTYQFGNSFLERSFEKPVRVTRSIVLKPPTCAYHPLPNDLVISISAGAAFGTGFHPTTRLSLQALEYVCRTVPLPEPTDHTQLLDIGTGSGVLVIAGIKLGLGHGIGIDIDPCSRVEALDNVKLNNLTDTIDISGDSIDAIIGNFSIIIANLRFPTLKAYFRQMVGLMDVTGSLIVSGIRSNEVDSIGRMAVENSLTTIWEEIEQGWGAMAFQGPGPLITQ